MCMTRRGDEMHTETLGLVSFVPLLQGHDLIEAPRKNGDSPH